MRIVSLTKETTKDILDNLLKRSPNNYGKYESAVAEILANVKTKGDEALFSYTKEFDKAEIAAETIKVTEEEIRLTLENFYDKAYFMVRINEGTPGNVSGGALTHLTGNLYLLEADEATVTIERQLEKE